MNCACQIPHFDPYPTLQRVWTAKNWHHHRSVFVCISVHPHTFAHSDVDVWFKGSTQGKISTGNHRFSNEICDFPVIFPLNQEWWFHECLSTQQRRGAVEEDDDVSTVLKGVSSASLEALNFVDYLNQKYEAYTISWDFFTWFLPSGIDFRG